MNRKDYVADEKVLPYLNNLTSFRRVMNRMFEVKRPLRTVKIREAWDFENPKQGKYSKDIASLKDITSNLNQAPALAEGWKRQIITV